MKALLLAGLLIMPANGGWAAETSDRMVCEGRDPDAGAAERERACSAILAQPGLGPVNQSMALVHRGWARSQQGLLAQARADYDLAVAANPGSHIALNERALLALRQDRLDAALADYNAAIKIAPREAYPRYGRGLTFLRKHDRKRGEADIAAARRLDPQVDATFARIGFRP